MSASGFILSAWRETLKTKSFRLDASVPLETAERCCACHGDVKPLAALVGGDGTVVRKGVCAACGTMLFMDRPARDWLVGYYSDVWDEAAVGGTAPDLAHFTDLRPSRTIASGLVTSAGLPAGSSVFEIGVGYGGVLKHLADAGFRVMGLENSAHRASSVRSHYGWPIWHGEWGSDAVIDAVEATQGSIDCFFTHHVLEHVHSPDRFIAACARLQKPGGRLVVAVPNCIGEHACLVAFYLPHLHNFTKEGLESLLNRHGYEVEVDASPDETNIILRAVRADMPKVLFPRRDDYIPAAAAKMRRGLALDDMPASGAAQLYWEDGWGVLDAAQMRPVAKASFAERLKWKALLGLRVAKRSILTAVPAARQLRNLPVLAAAAKAAVPPRGYTMYVQALTGRVTDLPVEITFNGPITFLMK